jgi:biopolymer transport protein ExbD
MAEPKLFPEDLRKRARIEIIPLIDVIFFLLATFVLFTLSLNRIVSIPVQLPIASVNPNQKPDPDMVTLLMSDAGTCYWNGEMIPLNEIAPRLQQYKTQVAIPRVLIAGDKRARFGYTVLALDEVRKAGIDEVSVETRTR